MPDQNDALSSLKSAIAAEKDPEKKDLLIGFWAILYSFDPSIQLKSMSSPVVDPIRSKTKAYCRDCGKQLAPE